jgi:hypothetical protein
LQRWRHQRRLARQSRWWQQPSARASRRIKLAPNLKLIVIECHPICPRGPPICRRNCPICCRQRARVTPGRKTSPPFKSKASPRLGAGLCWPASRTPKGGWYAPLTRQGRHCSGANGEAAVLGRAHPRWEDWEYRDLIEEWEGEDRAPLRTYAGARCATTFY